MENPRKTTIKESRQGSLLPGTDGVTPDSLCIWTRCGILCFACSCLNIPCAALVSPLFPH